MNLGVELIGQTKKPPEQAGSKVLPSPVTKVNRPLAFIVAIALSGLFPMISWLPAASAQMQSRQKLQIVTGTKAKQPDDAWKARWKIGLSGSQSRSENTAAHLVDFSSDFDLKYFFDPSFYISISPSLQFQTGSTQSPDPGTQPANSVQFNEASANWKPTTWSHLLAGALDQGARHSRLLIGSRPFPGARSQLEFGEDKLLARVAAETAIPTSSSLSTNANQIEPTPSFNSAQLELEGKPSVRGHWLMGAGVFAYENLPSAMAYESSFRGNTVDRLTDTHSVFREHYRGVEGRVLADLPVIKRVSLKLNAEGLQNTAVQSGLNQAWAAGGGLGFRWDRSTDIAITGEAFRIEPDAAVASFISGDFGSTNRVGYAGELKLSFQKGRYNISTRAGESELIFVNSPQSRERFFLVRLETGYVDF